MDFFDYGHSIVDVIDPQVVAKAWEDIDKIEIENLLRNDLCRLMTKCGGMRWLTPKPPQTPNFTAFVDEIEKVSNVCVQSVFVADCEQNMWRCWERYGKKHIRPKLIEERLTLLSQFQSDLPPLEVGENIWVMIPLVTISPEHNFTLMESSHRKLKNAPDKPYSPTVLPGQALMFNAGLRTGKPKRIGAVAFIRVYDVTGL